MAAILSAEHLSKSYTLKKLLTDVTIYVGEHDRIGVVGVNGTGKSTLLKLLSGLDEPDGGVVMRKNGLRVSYLPQMPDYSQPRTAVQQVLFDAPKDVGAPDEYEAKALLSQFGIDDFDADVRTLSGGQKKRVALAAALIRPVDLLMLDEPTNHIDAETIALLEERLAKYRGALMMVTHDRYFLDNVAGWILELDRGRGIPWKGNYSSWLDQKEQRLELEQKKEDARIKAMKHELEWVRQNAKGRQAKSKARLNRFEEMSSYEYQKRNETNEIFIPVADRLGDKVIEFKNVSKGFGDRLLIDDLSFSIPPGAIVGVIGPNGAGKSTLFKMITGKETPDSGEIDIGPTVKLSAVSQTRESLPNDKTVWEAVSDGLDILKVGKFEMPSRAYLGRFNFKGGDQQKIVGTLSGGERGRLHMAKTLLAGGNVLLLDEPSNDLDVETLRALEEALLEFAGCAMVISHDRWFLDRIATHILAFEGDSKVEFFAGNYTEYEADKKRRLGDAATPHRLRFKPLKH